MGPSYWSHALSEPPERRASNTWILVSDLLPVARSYSAPEKVLESCLSSSNLLIEGSREKLDGEFGLGVVSMTQKRFLAIYMADAIVFKP